MRSTKDPLSSVRTSDNPRWEIGNSTKLTLASFNQIFDLEPNVGKPQTLSGGRSKDFSTKVRISLALSLNCHLQSPFFDYFFAKSRHRSTWSRQLSLCAVAAGPATKVQGQLVKKKRNIWSRFGSAVRHRTVEFRLGDQAQRLQRGRISLVCARGDYKTIPRARVLKWVQTGVACAAKSVEPA